MIVFTRVIWSLAWRSSESICCPLASITLMESLQQVLSLTSTDFCKGVGNLTWIPDIRLAGKCHSHLPRHQKLAPTSLQRHCYRICFITVHSSLAAQVFVHLMIVATLHRQGTCMTCFSLSISTSPIRADHAAQAANDAW